MPLENTSALCTLADVIDDTGVTGRDSALERKILVASGMIVAYCRRNFWREVAKTEKLAGQGTCRLLPSLTPINSVLGIMFDGGEVDPASYEIDQDSFGNGWAIYARAGWGWTVGGIMTASGVQPIPGTEEKLFSVTYDGGFSLPNDSNQGGPPLPMALREACVQLAATLFRSRGQDANVIAESDGDASIQRGYLGGVDSAPSANGGLPGAIAAMVKPWRRGI